jgi:hypothetical protein
MFSTKQKLPSRGVSCRGAFIDVIQKWVSKDENSEAIQNCNQMKKERKVV